jgi:dimethylsulfide dehydrogenase subunit alpha/complex iron-sulfur molybdoenzyme family reductase subunit alpha
MLGRRAFIKLAGVLGFGLSVPAKLLARVVRVEDPLHSYSDRGWEEIYRKEFASTRGDAAGYAFHCSNCQGNCAFQLFSKDGMIVREEQLAQYPQINPEIPDANPRGCNKGVIHSQAMYEKDRLLHPLKRAGKRGEGKWRRISWDRAVREISEKTVDVLKREGPGGVMIHTGTGIISQGRRAGPLRLGSLLGSIRMYPSSAVGDMFTGASLAYGIPNVGHSLDAWFEMNMIVLWAFNPNVTRIPDAHYLWEAKWRGAKIVVISPDYNQTAVHADLWVPIEPGSDSFLAMSLVHVVLKEKLYQEAFVREQTDLPFLVRRDTGKLLREIDLREKGSPEVFYLWDQKTGRAVEAQGSRGSKRDTLRLGEIVPALEGSWEIRGKDGVAIPVTTVFELVRAEAARFPPEETHSKTGIHPGVVYRLARDFARAEKAGITIGFSLHKYAWGILACWGQALLCALTGHAADTGGLDTEHQWSLGGIGPLSNPKPPRFESGFLSEWMAGRMWETFRRHYDDGEFSRRAGMSVDEVVRLAERSLKEKWFAYFGEPRVRILFADNIFRRNKSSEHYKRAVLEATELYVNVNYRMDSSAELADYVLPAQGHYEGWDIRGEVGYHRFVNLVVPPPGLKAVGEARSEWEICRLLAQGIERAARARRIAKIIDPGFTITRGGKSEPVTRDLDTLHADFTMGGMLMSDRDVVKWLLENVSAFKPWNFEDAVERGFIVLNSEAGLTSPLYTNRPYHSFEEQVYLRRPYPTLSGRQTFCIDQEVFLRLGSPVPTAREPLHPSRFPLRFYTPHTRWGIHSTWRSNKYLLRLQRGVPHVYLNPGEAAKRGISDGERVRVWNDVGEFYATAKLHPSAKPGTLMMEHAWEPHQFQGKSGMDAPVAGLLSPFELAGGWGHLKFSAEWDGNQLANESSVEIERA